MSGISTQKEMELPRSLQANRKERKTTKFEFELINWTRESSKKKRRREKTTKVSDEEC